MTIKNHIPNLLTCSNLAIGCSAIVAIFGGSLENIIYFIIVAGIFDFLDGFSAKLLKATSLIGKDLDSLADMVTFGVVPSMVMFVMLKAHVSHQFMPYLAVLIAVFSALRLAKFNNDDRQTDTFYGLPTPANAMFICGLPLLIQDSSMQWLDQPTVLLAVTVISSLLLVADIKLLALKFKSYGWKTNEFKYTLIGISVLLLIYLGLVALPLIILLYLVLSLIANALSSS